MKILLNYSSLKSQVDYIPEFQMEDVAERERTLFNYPLCPDRICRRREPLGNIGAHRVDVILVFEGHVPLNPGVEIATQHFLLFGVEVGNSIVGELWCSESKILARDEVILIVEEIFKKSPC